MLKVVGSSKSSEQLLSTDTHSGTSSYKFTYSCEIIPICKDDLICLPQKQARSLSNISYVSLLPSPNPKLTIPQATSALHPRRQLDPHHRPRHTPNHRHHIPSLLADPL
jgi:hypothetical protein